MDRNRLEAPASDARQSWTLSLGQACQRWNSGTKGKAQRCSEPLSLIL